jgi:hypothetical protein
LCHFRFRSDETLFSYTLGRGVQYYVTTYFSKESTNGSRHYPNYKIVILQETVVSTWSEKWKKTKNFVDLTFVPIKSLFVTCFQGTI